MSFLSAYHFFCPSLTQSLSFCVRDQVKTFLSFVTDIPCQPFMFSCFLCFETLAFNRSKRNFVEQTFYRTVDRSSLAFEYNWNQRSGVFRNTLVWLSSSWAYFLKFPILSLKYKTLYSSLVSHSWTVFILSSIFNLFCF